MNLSSKHKTLITKVINVFESGKPDGNYSVIAIFNDGPNDIRQITYGRSQTTEYGNLAKLVKNYAAASGIYSKKLKPFVDKVGVTPLTDDDTFKTLLKKAGNEDPVMRTVQDVFFDEVYYKPAIKWASDRGFILPLSALVIYDSFIQSGSILSVIRNMFPETVPANGGNEIEWTTAYVNARHEWLANHSREAVRSTTYRTKCFKAEIDRGNWPLTSLPINANRTKVS
ncbi:MAG TPA: chitosanase [Pyrinomonadaceae bacterium]|nr:chitosanase [Acidobacteriota bacterium]HQZ97984.1 chitosanase [Pyrinomonadaceae bacterium]